VLNHSMDHLGATWFKMGKKNLDESSSMAKEESRGNSSICTEPSQ
jgi:hypothetical protein